MGRITRQEKGRATVWIAAAVSLSCAMLSARGDAPAQPDFATHLRPFLTEYCYGCHGNEKHKAEVNFEALSDAPRMVEQRELWEKVRDMLETHEMPPENKPQPQEERRQSMVEFVDAQLGAFDCSGPANPGKVTIRRLNRNEYRNTIRDLIGVDYDTGGQFPNDESGYGFDNIGDVLSLPPMLMEKYLAAAEDIAQRAIVTEDPGKKRARRLPASAFQTQGDAISTVEEEVWGFYREGEISTEQEFNTAGEYVLRLKAYGEQAGPDLPKMAVRLDGQEIKVQPIKALEGAAETVEVPIQVKAGKHRLAVAFLNNFNSDGDRNLFLASFEVVGPLGEPEPELPEPHRRIIPRSPAKGEELTAARDVLRNFATRAYRRPATDAEVERLVRLARMAMDDGANFAGSIQLAVQAVLVSPHFLYRWELDPEALAPGQTRDLGDYELVSRLSYFLWSSTPDDELFALAAAGELRKPETLVAQVRRMLKDTKASALVQNFGGQWLQIRNLEQVEPDPTLFPNWTGDLRDAMRRETELFLGAILTEDRSIRELLDAEFTFVNETLARHYGIPGVSGPEFQRVRLDASSGRGGVLTQGSVLTITSNPTRTSPVLRGKWILEQILGTPPPPPPPDIPQLEEGEEASKTATVRQRLELHRSKPDCATCHQKMDPLGFALENFDAIGAWRATDGPHPVDSSAELPGGRKFEGPAGLKAILKQRDDFPRALAEKMLTYALGRGLEFYDRCAVDAIVANLAKNDFKFSALVLGVVTSEPFLKRQPEPLSHEQHARAYP